MGTIQHCQSCNMPIELPEQFGLEKDGSLNRDYCKYCYQNGAFTRPGITLGEMKTHVQKQMENMKMERGIINGVISSLNYLKRWRTAAKASL